MNKDLRDSRASGLGGFGQRSGQKGQAWEAKNLAKKALDKVKLGNLEEAETLLEQALQLEPKLTDARMTMGFIKKKKEDYVGALAEYENCVDKGNNGAVAAYNIGNIYRHLGELSQAIRSYEKALEKHPEFIEAITNLGLSMLEAGSVGQAIETLEKANRINPEHIAALNNLGKAYIHGNKLEEAISTFHKAHKKAGNVPEILRNIGAAYIMNGQGKEALTYIEQALAIDPSDVIALGEAAKCYTLQADYDYALTYCNKALSLKPSDANAAYQKAMVLEEKGTRGECPELYEKAVRGPTYIYAAERRLSYYIDARADKIPLTRTLRRLGRCNNATEAIELNYALAKYKEDLGEKSAYSNYKLANELELGTKEHVELNKNDVIQRNEAFECTSSGSRGPETLILLVGLPLSGGEVIENILKASGITTLMKEFEYKARLDEFILDSNIYGLPSVKQEAMHELNNKKGIEGAGIGKRIFSFEYCRAATRIFPSALIIECKMSSTTSFLSMMRTKSQIEGWGCGEKQIASYIHYYNDIMDYQRQANKNNMITIDIEELKQNAVAYWQEVMETTAGLRGLAANLLSERQTSLIESECQKLRQWPYEGSLNKKEKLKKQIKKLIDQREIDAIAKET